MAGELIERILQRTTGNLELRRAEWNPQTQRYDFTDRIFTRDPKGAQHYVTSGTGDVFHGINTRKQGATSGTKDDVFEIVCITGDVDFKKTSPDKFEAKLREFPQQRMFSMNRLYARKRQPKG